MATRSRTKSVGVFDWLLTLVFKMMIICVCVLALLYIIGVVGTVLVSAAHSHCSLSAAVSRHVGFWDYMIVIGVLVLYFYYNKK